MSAKQDKAEGGSDEPRSTNDDCPHGSNSAICDGCAEDRGRRMANPDTRRRAFVASLTEERRLLDARKLAVTILYARRKDGYLQHRPGCAGAADDGICDSFCGLDLAERVYWDTGKRLERARSVPTSPEPETQLRAALSDAIGLLQSTRVWLNNAGGLLHAVDRGVIYFKSLVKP